MILDPVNPHFAPTVNSESGAQPPPFLIWLIRSKKWRFSIVW